MTLAKHPLTARFRPLSVKMTQRATPWHHVRPAAPMLHHKPAQFLCNPQVRFHQPENVRDERAEIIALEERQQLRGRRTKTNPHSKRKGTPKANLVSRRRSRAATNP